MPDYANSRSLGSINSYTATENGWVVVGYYGYATGGAYTASVKINSKPVFSYTTEAPGPNGARASRGQIMIPVSVDDKLTWPNNSNVESSYFIPGKWVAPTN